MLDSSDPTRSLLQDAIPFKERRPQIVGVSTPVPRLTVWSSTRDTSPTAALFEPMFYTVLRGAKVLIMGANRFELSTGACAASSFGLPYTHQLTGATPDRPYVGISLHLDIDMLRRVVLEMPKRDERWTCAVAAGDLAGPVGDAFLQLVGLLGTPDDIDVLAPHYEAALYYRLLQSSMGETLRQIGHRDERFQKLKAAADWLATNYSDSVVVPDLAASAGMSVTSFHRHFKAITGYSPLAFQRHIRLLEARKLLTAGNGSVSRVAFDVGYLSPSQFSREYKSMFGSSPVADLQR
ncbi:AraC family transcriptional regulator [Rhizobium sp. EC-SD404]|uniref:AraC family transcriptional regulator n=1 Tax=Rhizobium sp. EC-SD404 TaxID=2038389 RepID=UPI00125F01EE|nr:AraC family transcriptional regulator [Rhizobium sp. EC-SD404]